MFTTTQIAIQCAREALIDASYDLNLINKLPSNLVCKLQAAHQKLHPFFSVLQLQLLIQKPLAIEIMDCLVESKTFFDFFDISAGIQCKLILNRDGLNRYKLLTSAFENLTQQKFNASLLKVILEKNSGDLTLVYLSAHYDFFRTHFRQEEIEILVNYHDAHLALKVIHENFDKLEPIFGIANLVKIASKPSNYLNLLAYLRCEKRLEEKSFSFSEVLNIILACQSSNVLEALLDHYNDLRTLGLEHSEICHISRYHGALAIYKVLKANYTNICKAGFTHDQVISMASHSGGSNNLLAALDAIASPLIKKLGLTATQIYSFLNREAGRKNLKAFEECYEPLSQLGFDLGQIIEIFSRRYAPKIAASILKCSEEIKRSKMNSDSILNIIKKEDGAESLSECVSLYQSLIDSEISPEYINNKLSSHNYLNALRELVKTVHLAAAIAQTELMPEFEMDIPMVVPPSTPTVEPSAKRKQRGEFQYPSHRAAPLVKRNIISSKESESEAIMVMRRILSDYDAAFIKEITTQVSLSDASVLLTVPKKRRDEMGFLSFHKYTSKKQDHRQYYHLKLNVTEYKAWESLQNMAVQDVVFSEQDLISTEQVENAVEQNPVPMSSLQNNTNNSIPNRFSFNDNFGSTLFVPVTLWQDEDDLGFANNMRPEV